MKSCYVCNTDLIRKDKATKEQLDERLFASKEHIIPNFLGGRLTSYDLLCERCNSKLGTEVDGSLSNQLDFLRVIKVKKSRKSSPYKKGFIKDKGVELLVNDNLESKIAKPQIIYDDKGNIAEVYAKSKEQAEGLIKSELKASKTEKEIQDFIKKAKFSDVSKKTEEVHFRGFLNSDSYYGIAKIAINFYLSKGLPKEEIQGIIDYILSKGQNHDYVRMFHPISPLYELEDNQLFNAIFLKGDKKKKLLYCYVDLFNVAKYIVVLSDKFDAESFEEAYQWNLVENVEEECSINFTLFRNPVYMDTKNEQTEKSFNEDYIRLMKFLKNRNV